MVGGINRRQPLGAVRRGHLRHVRGFQGDRDRFHRLHPRQPQPRPADGRVHRLVPAAPVFGRQLEHLIAQLQRLLVGAAKDRLQAGKLVLVIQRRREAGSQRARHRVNHRVGPHPRRRRAELPKQPRRHAAGAAAVGHRTRGGGPRLHALGRGVGLGGVHPHGPQRVGGSRRCRQSPQRRRLVPQRLGHFARAHRRTPLRLKAPLDERNLIFQRGIQRPLGLGLPPRRFRLLLMHGADPPFLLRQRAAGLVAGRPHPQAAQIRRVAALRRALRLQGPQRRRAIPQGLRLLGLRVGQSAGTLVGPLDDRILLAQAGVQLLLLLAALPADVPPLQPLGRGIGLGGVHLYGPQGVGIGGSHRGRCRQSPQVFRLLAQRLGHLESARRPAPIRLENPFDDRHLILQRGIQRPHGLGLPPRRFRRLLIYGAQPPFLLRQRAAGFVAGRPHPHAAQMRRVAALRLQGPQRRRPIPQGLRLLGLRAGLSAGVLVVPFDLRHLILLRAPPPGPPQPLVPAVRRGLVRRRPHPVRRRQLLLAQRLRSHGLDDLPPRRGILQQQGVLLRRAGEEPPFRQSRPLVRKIRVMPAKLIAKALDRVEGRLGALRPRGQRAPRPGPLLGHGVHDLALLVLDDLLGEHARPHVGLGVERRRLGRVHIRLRHPVGRRGQRIHRAGLGQHDLHLPVQRLRRRHRHRRQFLLGRRRRLDRRRDLQGGRRGLDEGRLGSRDLFRGVGGGGHRPRRLVARRSLAMRLFIGGQAFFGHAPALAAAHVKHFLRGGIHGVFRRVGCRHRLGPRRRGHGQMPLRRRRLLGLRRVFG